MVWPWGKVRCETWESRSRPFHATWWWPPSSPLKGPLICKSSKRKWPLNEMCGWMTWLILTYLYKFTCMYDVLKSICLKPKSQIHLGKKTHLAMGSGCSPPPLPHIPVGGLVPPIHGQKQPGWRACQFGAPHRLILLRLGRWSFRVHVHVLVKPWSICKQLSADGTAFSSGLQTTWEHSCQWACDQVTNQVTTRSLLVSWSTRLEKMDPQTEVKICYLLSLQLLLVAQWLKSAEPFWEVPGSLEARKKQHDNFPCWEVATMKMWQNDPK